MSPPRFATPAVWREPSSLQTPGTLGESELVQLQCRYPCSARTTSRKTGKNGGYVSSKMQRFLYPSTWDCLDNYTVQGTLYKPLHTGLLHQALKKLLWYCCQCLFQRCSTVFTQISNSFPIQVQTQPVPVSVWRSTATISGKKMETLGCAK